MAATTRKKPQTLKQRQRTSTGQMSAFHSYHDYQLPNHITYTGGPDSSADTLSFLHDWSLAKACAIDVETYCPLQSPDGALDPAVGRIRLIQVALPSPSGRVLIHDVAYHTLDDAAETSLIDMLRSRLSDPDHLCVGHNFSFDLMWLYAHYGIRARKVACTQLLSQVIWAGLGLSHSLAATTERVLSRNIDKGEQRSDWGSPLLSREQLVYAAEDASITLALYKALMIHARTEQIAPQVIEAEMLALPAYAEMNWAGMPVRDASEDLALYQTAYLKAEALFLEVFPGCSVTESKASKAAKVSKALMDGEEPDQLALDVDVLADPGLIEAIKQVYGIDVTGLSKADLAAVTDMPGVRDAAAARYLKNAIDYLRGIQSKSLAGRIRGGFTQIARNGRGRSTSTGKSKTAPGVNLQNPPSLTKAPSHVQALGLPDIRSVFTLPVGGPLAMGATDYSAAHGRIAAQTTGDQAFIHSNNDPSIDNHCDVAAELAAIARYRTQQGVPYAAPHIMAVHDDRSHPDSEVASLVRSLAKNCFYGWLNGAGVKKISSEIGSHGIDCFMDQARAVLSALQNKFPGIATFHTGVKRYCKDRAQMIHPLFPNGSTYPRKVIPIWGLDGRRMFMPVVDGDYGLGASPNAAYMALWMSVESTAKKLAMGRIRLIALDHPEWEFLLRLDCHDELVWTAAVDYYTRVDEMVWTEMVRALQGYLPDVKAYKKPWKASKLRYAWCECK